MYGNGVRTGMEATAAIRRPIQQDLHLALTVFSVAAAGSTVPGNAVCRIVASTIPSIVTTTAASALFFSNYNYNPSFCTKLKPSVIDVVKQASEERTKQAQRKLETDVGICFCRDVSHDTIKINNMSLMRLFV